MKQITKTPAAPAVATKPSTQEPPKPAPVMASVRDLNDVELRDALSAIRAEVKRREELAEANRPRRGDQVVITSAGRYQGKRGVVVISRKTRCFVDVEGFKQPAYVLHSDVEKAS